MRKVIKCPKGIGLVSNFINFLEEKKKKGSEEKGEEDRSVERKA